MHADQEPMWTATQCAAAWGIAESTWRDAVAAGRGPAPLSGFDDDRRRLWDPEQVRTWVRAGRGARTDLPAVPATVAELAALLLTLTADHGPVVPRAVIRAQWLAAYPEDTVTASLNPGMRARRATRQGPRADGRPHTAGTAVRRKVGHALARLEKAGAIRREGTTAVVVLDAALLAELADSPDPKETRP